MRRLYALLLITVSILFYQCQKEPAYIGGPDTVVTTPDPLTAHLQGNIYDENGQPASGVTITVGAKTTITNSSGYFRITDAALDKKASLVVAEKPGYFKAFRSFSANTGTNQVEIKLVKRNSAGTVNAAAGGDVTLSNGGKITLPANGVVVASSGAAYNGTVNVYAAYIDPTASDIYQVVPGSFMANNASGNRVLLSSYGMMAVDLEGSAGEKLQVKTGSLATLTTPIPSGAQAAAPASIPMWYVDEQTGLWKEEGTAVKQGNTYVADVKHFTYWNCDMQLATIFFTATLKDANGNPMVHTQIVIRPATGTYYGSAHGITDSAGHASGPIPANLPLVMQVLDMCGNVVYTQNIGPYSQNVNLGDITIPNSVPNTVTIKGTLYTCAGTRVVNGYAIVIVNNRVHYAAANANGEFSTNYIVCSGASSASIIGVDGTTQQQGSTMTVTLTSGINNVGNVSACGTSTNQYINYTLDGTSYSISSAAQDSITAYASGQGTATNYYHIVEGSHSNTASIRFMYMTPAAGGVGTYPMSSLRVMNSFGTLVTPFNVTLTMYPATVGQFYEGNFSGQYRDSTGSTAGTLHNISANFRVRRLQ